MLFDKESKRMYAEVDKFSNLQWANRNEFELVQSTPGKKRTRSKTSNSVAESKKWIQDTDAQFGYGEVTRVSLALLIE